MVLRSDSPLRSRPSDPAAAASACPSESTILALWRGELDADARERVEEHLSRCPECRELVSVLAPTSASSSEVVAGQAPPVAIGQIVADKYRIEAVLGRGGMGWVVRARHLVLRTPVALKFLSGAAAECPEAVLRFIREARAAALIESEHVVRVLDAGKLAPSGEPYLALECLEGADLARRLEESGPFSIAAAVDSVCQACEALALAHARGIVHRDIKPANLFLTRRADGRSLVKVLDFGIAKVARAVDDRMSGGDITKTAALIGSPSYMAPEQIHSGKDVDARVDVWALGVVLFELLSGELPFHGDNLMAICAAIVTDAPASLRALRPEVPPALEAIVLGCLEKDPARRIPDVETLAARLAAFSETLPPSRRHASAPPPRRRTAFFAVLSTAAIALAAFALVVLRARAGTVAPAPSTAGSAVAATPAIAQGAPSSPPQRETATSPDAESATSTATASPKPTPRHAAAPNLARGNAGAAPTQKGGSEAPAATSAPANPSGATHDDGTSDRK